VGEQGCDHRGQGGEDADHGQVAAGHRVGQEGVGRQVEHGQQRHRGQQGRVVDAQAPAPGAQGADQGGGQGAKLDPEGDPEDAAAGGRAALVDADEEQPEQHRRDQGEHDGDGREVTAIPPRTMTRPARTSGPGRSPLTRSTSTGSTAPLEARGATIAVRPVASAW
jgi:hypothetical protein